MLASLPCVFVFINFIYTINISIKRKLIGKKILNFFEIKYIRYVSLNRCQQCNYEDHRDKTKSSFIKNKYDAIV
jgi:predicted nucleic-acid-binding Zn-ribbon protein